MTRIQEMVRGKQGEPQAKAVPKTNTTTTDRSNNRHKKQQAEDRFLQPTAQLTTPTTGTTRSPQRKRGTQSLTWCLCFAVSTAAHCSMLHCVSSRATNALSASPWYMAKISTSAVSTVTRSSLRPIRKRENRQQHRDHATNSSRRAVIWSCLDYVCVFVCLFVCVVCVVCLFGCLVVCLGGWLCCLFGCVVCLFVYMFVCLVGWLVGWLVVCLVVCLMRGINKVATAWIDRWSSSDMRSSEGMSG